MKIKTKPTVKTVTARKPRACRKAAEPKAPKAAKSAEKSVAFTVRTDPGKEVYVAGTFNQWNPAGKKMADRKNSGLYSATLKLAPGRYEYKFVIDGTWCADPENLDFVQNSHGTLNSVIVVD